MTINSLTEWIKKYAPLAFKTVELSDYRDTRIAIDASLWIGANLSIIWNGIVDKTDVSSEDPSKDEAFTQLVVAMVKFAKKFMSQNITPVFIFDGIAPKEKTDTKQKRNDERKRYVEILNTEKGIIQCISPFSRTPEMIAQLKSAWYNVRPYIDHNYKKILQEILFALGISYMVAKEEAEKLCTLLCREGWVSAVFSNDSDNIAMSCPILIKGFSKKRNQKNDNIVYYVDIVDISEIYKQVKLTTAQFLDMCILLGCDFNEKLKGVGPVAAYNLINQYGSLENIAQKQDISSLNHIRCRQIMGYEDLNNCIMYGYLDYKENPGATDRNGRYVILTKYGHQQLWTDMSYYINNPPSIEVHRYIPPLEYPPTLINGHPMG